MLPLGAERYALQATISQETRDSLHRALELLGPAARPGDLDQVLKPAVALFVTSLEKKKFGGAGEASEAVPRRRTKGGRHIPRRVRRAVMKRDGGQCTFVSASGHRCEARRGLEFDHAKEHARGGEATEANIRLRCRAHNQYTAEQAFGAGFMQGKRENAKTRAATRRGAEKKSEAREAKTKARLVTREQREQEIAARAAAQERALQEFPWLREMQDRADADPQAPDGPPAG